MRRFENATFTASLVQCILFHMHQIIPLAARKRLALVAHDHCKDDLLAWVKYNCGTLSRHDLFATGTTGQVLRDATGLNVERFISGPLGGDQQIGARIVEGALDALFFFWDPLFAQPHDPDVRALLRVAVLYNIPIAMNRSTADFIISSPLFHQAYERRVTLERPAVRLG